MKGGYKNTEVGIIPEDWSVKTLNAINFDISDGNYSSKYPKASDFRPFGVPFIRANNIRNMTVIDDDMRFISPLQHQELQKGHLKKNDVLITTRGEIGQLALVPYHHIDSNINAQLVRINVSGTGVDHKYLIYALSSTSAQEQIKNLQTGSALKQLPVGRLNQLLLIFPPPSEQRVISKALSDVDALLSSLDRLIDKKRDLKQAAMQQLITGQTRLPGFSGEWEVKRLDEVGACFAGGTPSTTRTDYWGSGFFWLPSGRVQNNILKAPLDSEISITQRGLKESAAKLIKPQSVLLAITGATCANAALLQFEATANQSVVAIEPFEGYEPRFLYYSLLLERSQILSLQSGSAQGGVNLKIVKGLEIRFPTLSEQTAIANIISDMDAELALAKAQRDKTAILKQGMMQELLTGRTRLMSFKEAG